MSKFMVDVTEVKGGSGCGSVIFWGLLFCVFLAMMSK